MLRTALAVSLGKSVAQLSILLRKGAGTSLPGKVARKIDPQLLRNLGKQVSGAVVAVTGTNGKTTTCGLLAECVRQAGKRVVHNELGANMVPGITAALMNQSCLTGKLRADYAVLEVDEASLRGLTAELPVQLMLVTNLFRDQLDRYGELDTTAKMIQAGIHQSDVMTGAGSLILNGDDPLVTTLGEDPTLPANRKLRYFGIESVQYQNPLNLDCAVPFTREVNQCPACKGPLVYSQIIFGHLGHYQCAACGFQRPPLTVAAESVIVAPEASHIRLRYGTETVELTLTLPGLFNVYNLLAAAAASYELGLPVRVLAEALSHYQSVFGRAEKRVIAGKSVMIMLIKNPIGASEVLKVVGGDPNGKLMIALNDNYADGRDVSWIWDAQFEAIPADKQVMVSGDRADDMAIRLKYAGLPDANIAVEPDLKTAVEKALAQTGPDETLYILPTYTALLNLTKLLG